MKCNCGKEFEGNVCPYCYKRYTDKEIQDLKDVEMLNEDLEVWKKVQKYK